MKIRVLSSLVGLVILAVVLAFLNTLLLNVVIGIVSLVAVYELLNAAKLTRFPIITVLSLAMATVIPFARAGYINKLLMEILFLIVLAFFASLLKYHAVLRIEHIAMSFFFSIFVPVFFSCAVYLRDDFGPVRGGFYLLLALGSAWLSDTGAYFVGIRYGRHKLAPVISPKKTLEGSVGGLVVCTALLIALARVYVLVLGIAGFPLKVNYGLLALVTPIYSVIGMLGDLSASVIKRAYGVKDYGHIMPGHGGILDRFDSVLFTLPSVYILVRHVEIVTAL